MAIPSSVDEVTPAWLAEALGTDVDTVDVVDAHSGTTGRAKIRVGNQTWGQWLWRYATQTFHFRL